MARHRSPSGRHPHQQMPSRRAQHASGSTGGRSAAVRVRVLGGAAAATTAATLGTLVVEQPAEPGPTMHERLLGLSPAAAEDVLLGGAELRPSVEPISPDLDLFDASALVKAVNLADQREARRREEAAALDRCRSNRSSFGGVKPWVAQAGQLLRCEFDIRTVGGVAGRSSPSDHPRGLALDFKAGPKTGDALARCALANMRALSIKYVIWQQRINYGGGWEPMEDRGSPTANHMGHVHISFDAQSSGATAVPTC